MNVFKRRDRPRLESASIGETIRLLRSYVVQETIGPLRTIGKMLGFGLAGALLCGIGAILALLGVLRILQTETDQVFGGNWSFAPYLLTALVAILLVGVGAFGLLRARRDRP